MSESHIACPLVSVVIPFLNEVRFLKDAVESVFSQTYKNWEIVLVDDGSSDGSETIAEEYSNLYPEQVRLVWHSGRENKGLSASRNIGINNAKGTFIAFLDADDWWLPEKLTKQVAVFEAHERVSMICEASMYWSSWSDKNLDDVLIKIGAPGNVVYAPGELITHLYPLSKGAAPCPSGIVVRKDSILKLGGFEESFRGPFQLYEDQALLHKFYLNEYCFISSDCNNRYRQRIGSIVEKYAAGESYHMIRRYFLHWLNTYIEERNRGDQKLKKLIRKALRPYEPRTTIGSLIRSMIHKKSIAL